MAYTFAEDKSKVEVWAKDETYGKSDLYTKADLYTKSELYNKNETYNKDELYSKSETDQKLTDYALKTYVQNELSGYLPVGTQFVPTGSITMYGGTTAPAGWLICDGSSVSRTAYAALFAVIGTTYGSNSSTTFNVPNLQGRFPLGKSTSYNLGTTGGAATVTLSVNEMPSHHHRVQDDWGTALTWSYGQYSEQGGSRWGPWWGDGYGGSGQAQTTYVGGNQPHNNMPPYLSINYIIKA